MIGNQFQAKLLSNRSQAQNDFHHRERCADASSWPTAEREVGILRHALNEVFSPSFGTEGQRLIIKAWVSLGGPLKHEHLGSRRHGIAANFAIRDRFASQAVRWRIKAHRLFRNPFGEFQPWQVGRDGRAIPKHFIQFGVKLSFRFRICSEQIPLPGQRQGGGLVTGKKQGHHFVSQLPVAHLTAVFVASGQQHRQ